MGLIVRTFALGTKNRVCIPRRPADKWFSSGNIYFVPLSYKRHISLDEGKLVNAWTVINADSPTDRWLNQPELESDLVYERKASSRTKGGWEFYIPSEFRKLAWLPDINYLLTLEVNEDEEEINLWTPEAYNIQRYRDASV